MPGRYVGVNEDDTRFLVLIALVSPFVTGALHADVITVNPDGADYETIQAVDVASDGDEIQIQPGVYTGDGDQVVDTLGKSIVLRGVPDGTAAPLIDGEGVRRGIICRSGEGPGTVIEELVFQDCYPAWYDWNDNGEPDFWEYFGGAMWCRDGSAPTIRLCVFGNNRAAARSTAGTRTAGSDHRRLLLRIQRVGSASGGGRKLTTTPAVR